MAPVLEVAGLFGQVPRADLARLVGTGPRQARRLLSPLVARGLLVGAKDAPLRIAFPLGEAEGLFPRLWAPGRMAEDLPATPELDEALRAP